jgi:putative protein kinase ArgK-like GTPase of G3E family
MINEIVARATRSRDAAAVARDACARLAARAHACAGAPHHRARELASSREAARELPRGKDAKAPSLGITGTGGAGKSSLTDESCGASASTRDDRCASPSSRSTVAAQVGRRAARRPHSA